jgi:V/A-type H+/Na+-transporting ATPase subunit I
MLRTDPCRWFELVAARDDLAPLLQALAQGGAVELQTHAHRATPLRIEGADAALERYAELERSFHAHWPARDDTAVSAIVDPGATLARRLAQLEAWRLQAEPLIAERERLAPQERQFDDLGRLLDTGRLPAPALLAAAGTVGVEARLFALAQEAPRPPLGVLVQTLAAADAVADETLLLLVGLPEDLAEAEAGLQAPQARRIAWPADLDGTRAEAAARVAEQRAALTARRASIDAELQALARQHGLATALADIDLVTWLLRHGSALEASERLVWITGWTTAADEAAFRAPLIRHGLACVVQFPPPPAGAEAPLRLANPPWIRIFEPFARLLGHPGRDEADPSAVVAIVAPLLFGFMFGDVGQGALLCLAGVWLRRRAPMLVLLVPGGAMAMVFGLLFGTVFAREDLLPALWLRPLHEPATLLLAAVGLGVAVLLCGLALNALQAHWRGQARAWWTRDAGLALAYASLLAAFARPEALWLAIGGALWFALGSLRGAAPTPAAQLAALGAGLAKFTEQALQLLVNTVSFARVGAFALAHAGLSLAVTGVADAVGGVGYGVVLVLGNALILALEGLVVGIQTTRLLLFEFFVRFLEGRGRAFRPLPLPLRPPIHPAEVPAR